jgi:hypothetical protein
MGTGVPATQDTPEANDAPNTNRIPQPVNEEHLTDGKITTDPARQRTPDKTAQQEHTL